jgi:hypothetical protein
MPGNPLADISVTSQVDFVMARGAVFLGAGARR